MDIIKRIARESAPLTGLIAALIAALQLFDVIDLTTDQVAGIMAVVGAVILFLRAYITPVSDPALPEGTSVRLPDGGTGTVVKS